ncbi:MAG: TIM barrel protein [Eubacteriales bacterium]|nr:TIM barrel protein [Clostridiales bacterium]MDD6933294.1 TIM barrel protein [Eubacteriales bacterium]MDO4388920.1 TIM barrel protein [Eubacteriales bacterium]
MRLCVPIPCFFGDMDFCEGLRRVKALGYDAAETYNWKGLDFDAVRRTCEETGVELLSMCTSEFRMTDPTFRQAWLDGLEESCQAANRMGVKRLITQVGQDTGAPREQQHAAIVETLNLARPILEKSGVTIMLEPLNTLVNHPGYYLWSAVEGFEIIREVNHPLVKLVYDIYHQQVMEGNIIPNITKNLDCIAHLHSAGHPGRNELQYGENDYKVIFAAVDKAGYTGACGLEYRPLMDPEESLREAMRLYGK